jgi:hypothetical protein
MQAFYAQITGPHTKRKFKYRKELSPRGLECECAQKERSTSITKQLVFHVRGNDLSLLAGTTEGTDGRRFVLLHVVDFRLELDLPRSEEHYHCAQDGQ